MKRFIRGPPLWVFEACRRRPDRSRNTTTRSVQAAISSEWGDHHDGDALFPVEAAEQRHDFFAAGGVEVPRRLVGPSAGGALLAKARGDGDALLLAA